MKQILIINGPNLNMLGIREPDHYGRKSYRDLLNMAEEYGKKLGVHTLFFQSNHEGALVDRIQQAYFENTDGIIINPGAYTHTSIALLDALNAVKIPAVEVHISDVFQREDFRQVSYVRLACFKTIMGHGLNGYLEGMDALMQLFKEQEDS